MTLFLSGMKCYFERVSSNGTLSKESAKKIAGRLNNKNFNASNGWLDKFCKRNNITLRILSGESSSVDPIVLSDWFLKIPEIIKDYDKRDIYNLDETALFYRMLPGRSLSRKNGNPHGSKRFKQRITLLFCVNLVGDKETPLLIHTSLRPRCFKNIDMSKLGVSWYANKKAWMTSTIFKEWCSYFNQNLVKQNRKILLILDNATCHPDVVLSNIKFVFLPANTTSKSQPWIKE
ncbi:Tigger transposable element-derived protein 6 [Dictyocoela muelleri]|nr:Tigger transposable element-derived protein 6 [Dictyocoela muelleri]